MCPRAGHQAAPHAGAAIPGLTAAVSMRIVLQDLTGIPLLADLAAMRSVAERMGKNPKVVEPLVPVRIAVCVRNIRCSR